MMMSMEGTHGGNLEGPVSPDNYKRAVYRSPPRRFSVEMLPPVKQGGSYSFGLRICPITRGDRSSVSSSGSDIEYDVWRRWEDCLFFQETLEVEYKRMAQMKRQRLIAGKGVKKDGFYQQDMAASFESLPPGPAPDSIARSVHEYVPKLTKKGTLFRVSQATLDQRYNELKALIKALFAKDVPTLLQELRSDRIVTDFFGYWRRDHDLAGKNRPSTGRSSISSAVLSSYFSGSTASIAGDDASIRTTLASPPHSPSRSDIPSPTQNGKAKADVRSNRSQTSSATMMSSRNYPDTYVPRRRAQSASSSGSSSAPSSRNSNGSMQSSVTSIAEDAPLVFGYNPVSSEFERPSLEALPEGHEFQVKEELPVVVTKPPRSKRSSTEQRDHRAGKASAPPSPNDSKTFQPPPLSGRPARNRAVRESWQTTASASTYLESLNMHLPAPSHDFAKARMSVSSVATFMTNSSADAIIPRQSLPNTHRSGLHRSLSADSRNKRRMSRASTIRDDEPWSDPETEALDFDDLYDSFPLPSFHLPPTLLRFRPAPIMEDRPETALGHTKHDDAMPSQYLGVSETYTSHSVPNTPLASGSFPMAITISPPRQDNDHHISSSPTSSLTSTSLPYLSSPSESALGVPPSPTSSASSDMPSVTFSILTDSPVDSPVTPAGVSITIKAAHNDSIILLRITRDCEFAAVRERLRDKFLDQEGVTLSESFTLAIVLPAPTKSNNGPGVTRRGSGSSIGAAAQMKLVLAQSDWERAIAAMDGNKITIRILDTFS